MPPLADHERRRLRPGCAGGMAMYATYLARDLRQVSQIEALLDFRRLMELAALAPVTAEPI